MHAVDHITKERSTSGRERRNVPVQTKTSDVDSSMRRPLGNLGMLSQAGREATPVQLKCGACGDFEKEKELQLKALPGRNAPIVQREEGEEELLQGKLLPENHDSPGAQAGNGLQGSMAGDAKKGEGKKEEAGKVDLKSIESKSIQAKGAESKSIESKSAESKNGEAGKSASKRSSIAVMRKCKACEDEESVQTKPVVQREEQEELLQGKRSPAPASETYGAPASKSASEQKGKSEKPSAQSMPAAQAATPAAPASTPLREVRASTLIARRVQRKVVVGDADDEYEREADRVADAVLSATSAPYTHAAPSIRPVTGSLGGADVQGMMDDPHPGAAQAAGSRFESRLASSRGGGGMLPTEARLTMERGFGYDFSSVRIHTGNEADALNRDVHARAFTSGLDIYFASGEYNPASTEGRRLLAHELTHVVQQAGGSGGETGVQRAKYGDCPPLRGTPLGDRFEGHLRDANPTTLITQGRVPGGVTNVTDIDKVGNPDLYMSDPPLTLPGMKGKSIVNLTPTAADFEAMNAGKAKSNGTINMAPTESGGAWSGEFPQVKVGDIKPLAIHKAAEVLGQLTNYTAGYRDFLKQALAVFPSLTVKVPATPGVRISSLTIPPGYDYDQFDVETLRATPSNPHLIVGNKRYWLAFDNTEGIVYYFCLTHPFRPGSSSGELQDAFDALLPLKRSLRNRNGTSFGGGGGGGIGRKAAPSARAARTSAPQRGASNDGASNDGRSPDHATPRASDAPAAHDRHEAPAIGALSHGPSTGGAFSDEETREESGRKSVERRDGHPRIQRDKKKVDWNAKKKEWEKTREDWDAKHGKAFLNKKGNAPFIERLEVDQELASKGLKVKPVRESKEDAKKLKTVELWSGRSGEQIIFWRAKLGGAFDLVADFLDRMREKFAGFKDKLHKKLGKMNVSKFEGWKKKFLSILTEAAKIAFVQLLDALKDIFVNCMETVVDKILEKIGEEVEGIDIVEDVKGVVEKVEKFAKDVEKEFHERFAEYEGLIDTLTDIKRWVGIIADLVTLARAIWQGISCLSPPGLGCLWGLAGQFAFSAVLSLMMEIQEFRNAISGMVLGLFKDFVGDRFKALMMWGLEQVGLDKYADPAACSPTESGGGGSGDGLGLITAPFAGGAASQDDMAKELRKWEEDNKDLLLRETLEGLKGTKGITLTSQQLLELLKALKDAGWTKEEIEKNFGGATGASATFEELMARLKKAKDEKAPPAEEKKDEPPPTQPPADTQPPQPAEQQPPPVTAPEPGGGGGEPAKDDKEKTAAPGSSVPVLDAAKAGAGGGGGTRTSRFGTLVAAQNGHTAHPSNPPIKVTVWIYEIPEEGAPKHVLTLTNVEVVVAKRTWDPPGSSESTAKRLKVHYKLVKPVPLDSVFPDVTLVGDENGMLHGYIKYR